MNLLFRIVCFSLVAGLFMVGATPAFAHLTFKKQLEKKYANMKVNCNACHVDKKPKTERNEFGKLFAKEFDGMNISATFKSKKKDDKKNYEKDVMLPAFDKALEKIKKMTKEKDGEETYDEIIKAGKMPFIVPKSDKGK